MRVIGFEENIDYCDFYFKTPLFDFWEYPFSWKPALKDLEVFDMYVHMYVHVCMCTCTCMYYTVYVCTMHYMYVQWHVLHYGQCQHVVQWAWLVSGVCCSMYSSWAVSTMYVPCTCMYCMYCMYTCMYVLHMSCMYMYAQTAISWIRGFIEKGYFSKTELWIWKAKCN